MGAEDFAYMLEERPGAFIWLGNGDSAALHHPAYNFNDEAIPVGTSYLGAIGGNGAGGMKRVTAPLRRGSRPAASAPRAAIFGRGSKSAKRASTPRQKANVLKRVPSMTAIATADRNGRLCTTSTQREDIDLVHLLVVGDTSVSAPIQQQRADHASQNAGNSPLRVAPPLEVRRNGRCSRIAPVPTARATVHCTDIAAQTAPSICAGGMRTRSR